MGVDREIIEEEEKREGSEIGGEGENENEGMMKGCDLEVPKVVTLESIEEGVIEENKIHFDLGGIFFSHVMGFSKKKDAKIHLPFPSLIFRILKSQGFEPYKNEKLLGISRKYTVDQ